MALFILNPGVQPLGQFDVYDTDLTSVKGGEIMTLDQTLRTNASDKSSRDVLDGYLAAGVSEGTPTAYRVVTKIAKDSVGSGKLFFLADDGTTYYGVTLGSVIGTTVGQATTGTNLGPHTAYGSGKVTLWDKQGLYAVSLDAVNAYLVPDTAAKALGHGGLFDTPLPGELLYRDAYGLLARSAQQGNTADKVAAFIELSSKGSLVTTPARLVGAAEVFDRVKIEWFGTGHSA